MLKLTRVTGIMDVGRLQAALATPGIDPRIHLSLASVQATAYDENGEGQFADVVLVPSMVNITCRVGSWYAGPGFGFNVPVEVGDEVVVCLPEGDPNTGGVIVARLNSASDQLPSDATDNPQDLVLVVKDGQSLRIKVSGGGKVYLGDTNASAGALSTNDGVDYMAALNFSIETLTAIQPQTPATVAALLALQTLQGNLQVLPPGATPANVGKAWPVGASEVNVQ